MLHEDRSAGANLAMFDLTLNWISNLKAVSDLNLQKGCRTNKFWFCATEAVFGLKFVTVLKISKFAGSYFIFSFCRHTISKSV